MQFAEINSQWQSLHLLHRLFIFHFIEVG